MEEFVGKTVNHVSKEGDIFFTDGTSVHGSFNVGIYKIVNKINGKEYIGSSKNIKQRVSEHFKKSSSKSLREDMENLGHGVFTYEIVKLTSLVDRKEIEAKILGDELPYYNISNGTAGKSRIKVSKYSSDGDLLETYEHIGKCKTSINNSMLRGRLNKPIITDGFLFVREGTPIGEIDSLLAEVKNPDYDMSVRQWDGEGNLLNTFKTAREASAYLGLAKGAVSKAIRKGNLCKGYIFTRGKSNPPKYLVDRLLAKM